MTETHKNRDLDSFFREELRLEAKKVIPFTAYTNLVIDAVRDQGDVHIVYGTGDFFLPDQMGHVTEYNHFRGSLGKFSNNISSEAFQKKMGEIKSYFTARAHRDYDIVVVIGNDVKDKESFRKEISSSLEQSLQEEISRHDFVKDITKSGIFNGFDWRTELALKEKEFLRLLEEQAMVDRAFPYNVRTRVNSSDSPIKQEKIESGKSVILSTKQEIPIIITNVQTSPSRSRERWMDVRIEAGHTLSEPLNDILEKGKGATICGSHLSKELENALKNHREMTKGLPRSLDSQLKVYERYIDQALKLDLGEDFKEAITEYMELAKKLALPQTLQLSVH